MEIFCRPGNRPNLSRICERSPWREERRQQKQCRSKSKMCSGPSPAYPFQICRQTRWQKNQQCTAFFQARSKSVDIFFWSACITVLTKNASYRCVCLYLWMNLNEPTNSPEFYSSPFSGHWILGLFSWPHHNNWKTVRGLLKITSSTWGLIIENMQFKKNIDGVSNAKSPRKRLEQAWPLVPDAGFSISSNKSLSAHPESYARSRILFLDRPDLQIGRKEAAKQNKMKGKQEKKSYGSENWEKEKR